MNKINKKFSDKAIILIVITVSFYIGILLYSDLNLVIDKIHSIDLSYLPIILSLMGFQILVLSIKFQRLLKKLKINISIKDSIKYFVTGLSLVATPGGAGTAIKLHLIKKKFGYAISYTLPIVFVERITELIAILVLMSFFLIWIDMYESVIAIILGFSIVALLLIISSNNKIFSSFNSIVNKIKFVKKLGFSLEESKKSYQQLLSKKLIAEATGWSIIGKISQFLAVYFIFLSVGIDLGIFFAGQIYYTSLILGAITFLPAGVIVTESSMLGLLVNNQVELSIATLIVIFTRIITTWMGMALGVISLKIMDTKD